MLYNGNVDSFGVLERISGIDPVFISHIKDLLQKTIELTDEEKSLRRVREEHPKECVGGTKGIECPRDIWDSDGILEESEVSIEAIENRIWGRGEGLDPITIIDRTWANNRKSNYVLYPYGTSTEDYPSRFLGICIGGTKLDDVIKAALKHSAIVANKYRWEDREPESKTVVIITDKWDQKRFNKAYKDQMLAHAVNDGIWYLFLFVNQFDIEQIPFLPNDRSSICGVTWKNLPEKVRKKYARRVLKSDSVVIKSTDYYTGQIKEYEINNLDKWKTRDDSRKGEIEKSKIGQFINACYDWADNTFMGDGPFSRDISKYYFFDKYDNGLIIFGKIIFLDYDRHRTILKKLEKLIGK